MPHTASRSFLQRPLPALLFFFFVAALSLFPIHAHAALTDGLVGLWTFDGPDTTDKIYDRSGQGNNGYFLGGATSSAKTIGHLGQALTFDGVSDDINIADNNAFSFTDGADNDRPNSFSAWVYINDVTASGFLASKANVISDEWTISSGGGMLFSTIVSSDQVAFLGRSAPLNVSSHQSKWIHVVTTYDGSETSAGIKIYINGVQSDTADDNGGVYAGMPNTISPLHLGSFSGNSAFFNGKLDDVRIYNRALTANEVKQLYQRGQVLKKPPNNLGLVGYWNFDDGTGTKATDFSGNGKTGTLTGAGGLPTWVTGKRGKALNLDGVDDQVILPSIDLGTTNSGSLWIDYRDSGDGVLVGRQGIGGGAGGYVFYVDQTDVYYSPVGGNFVTVAHGGLTSGQWNHLAVSRSGTSVTFYKNGVQIGVPQTLSSNDALSGIVSIGSYGDGTFPAQARIDDVRIYI